jgi:hypothetical protein
VGQDWAEGFVEGSVVRVAMVFFGEHRYWVRPRCGILTETRRTDQTPRERIALSNNTQTHPLRSAATARHLVPIPTCATPVYNAHKHPLSDERPGALDRLRDILPLACFKGPTCRRRLTVARCQGWSQDVSGSSSFDMDHNRGESNGLAALERAIRSLGADCR